jgi:hypothetical protein
MMTGKKILLNIKTGRGVEGSVAVSCDKRDCFIFR